MELHFVTDEKIAETSSKGNQEKWYDAETDRWCKLDQFGYEALSECAVSAMLEYSNIEADTPFSFVWYDMEYINVHGRRRTGCSSPNFLSIFCVIYPLLLIKFFIKIVKNIRLF